MTRVLLLAENWSPRIGGIEKYLEGITGALREQGFAVEVVAPKDRRFFWPIVRPAWLPLFIFLWSRKVAGGDHEIPFDILLCGKALFEGLLGYYLKKHLGIPYIVFTYGMEIEQWRKGEKSHFAKASRDKRKLERVLRSADRVVYINEITKKQLLELGVREEQLVKVMPGVDPYPSQGSGLPLRKGEQTAERYILSVGRLIPRKGFDTLIEAFGKLDQTKFGEVKLITAGDGPERQGLEELARQHMLQTSVEFLGQVSDEELQELYAGAEIFALTPKKIAGDIEGFGIVYLEAAVHGVPAVGTRTGGVPEAVIHDKTGLLVEPNNAQAAAIALMQLLANKELRERLGRQAQLRVREEFAWEAQIEPLTQALKAIRE